MSYTDSPLLILCAFLCFNFYWQYIFFIPTLPVKSFKRKVCSSGLKIDKAPLKLSILLTILLSYMYFYFHTSMFRYMSSTKFTTFMLYMYMFLKINCGKSNLRTRSAIFPVVLFLSYLHVFLYFHTWVFQTAEALGNHCSLSLYLLPAINYSSLYIELHNWHNFVHPCTLTVQKIIHVHWVVNQYI